MWIYEKKCIVAPLKEVVIYVRDKILNYYGDPDNEGVGFDSGFEEDNEPYSWHSDNGYILPPNREIYDTEELMWKERFWTYDDSLTQDIIDCFGYRRWVYLDPYGLNDDEEMSLKWKEYCSKTIDDTVSGKSISEILSGNIDVLYDVAQIIKNNEHFLFETLPSGTVLYRCVNYASHLKSVSLSNLASPPTQYASANRMSRQGNSMFYGAFDENTPLAEARTVKGLQYSYLGKFILKKDMLVLDITNLPQAPSIFDTEDYWGIRFLHEFDEALSHHIPSNQLLEYVPTQIMTDFFRQSSKIFNKQIMGIKYNSSKNGASNCVLFIDYNQCPQYLDLDSYTIH